MLRGLHDTKVPMIYAADRLLGRRPAARRGARLPLRLAGNGIWIGLSVGLAVVAALLLARWLRRERLGLTDERRAFG